MDRPLLELKSPVSLFVHQCCTHKHCGSELNGKVFGVWKDRQLKNQKIEKINCYLISLSIQAWLQYKGWSFSEYLISHRTGDALWLCVSVMFYASVLHIGWPFPPIHIDGFYNDDAICLHIFAMQMTCLCVGHVCINNKPNYANVNTALVLTLSESVTLACVQ